MYFQSCDIAFQVLVIILFALTIAATASGWIRPAAAITLFCGILMHGFFGSKLHALYHVSDRSARRLSILKSRRVWKVFSWLREFHEVHHVVNANYSLVLPLFDLIGGTYVSPKILSRLHAEDLFPRFDSRLSSSCEKPLF
jgi:sterol desaturase/sphingolipid hydroxylase (fatty acid hydroxylase superfamily)